MKRLARGHPAWTWHLWSPSAGTRAPELPAPPSRLAWGVSDPQAPVRLEVSSPFSSLPLHLLFLPPGCPPCPRPAKMLLPPESLPGLPPCSHGFSHTLRGPSPSESSPSTPVSPPDVSSLISGTMVDESPYLRGPVPCLALGGPYLYLPPASLRLFHETLSLAGKMLGFHGNRFFSAQVNLSTETPIDAISAVGSAPFSCTPPTSQCF